MATCDGVTKSKLAVVVFITEATADGPHVDQPQSAAVGWTGQTARTVTRGVHVLWAIRAVVNGAAACCALSARRASDALVIVAIGECTTHTRSAFCR